MATRKGTRLQTAILLDPPTMDTIDEMARREGLSRSDIIRRLIRFGLQFTEIQSNQIPPMRRAG
jgi:metal-responsive CopG/Arc/MetJ family transcriptional regulator